MRKFLTILWKTVKWSFIVFFIFFLSLFFRVQRIPDCVVTAVLDRCAPTNLVIHVDSLLVGFTQGVIVRNLRIYDRAQAESLEPLVSARTIAVLPFERVVMADELTYSHLPAGYYEEKYEERNARVEGKLPDVPRFSLVLTRPNILAVCAERVAAEVEIRDNCLSVDRIRLDWPDKDEAMALDGFCRVDLRGQVVEGEVKGFAKQYHIRPLLVALDVPVALPYMDAFTDVEGKVPATCGWKVNLVNSDFNLDLDLHPKMGKYNGVPMRTADGQIHLFVYTRGISLNYKNTIGPIKGVGPNGEPLEGTVVIEGVNGTNTVTVAANSTLPVAHLLKIGGFTGEYVDEKVLGTSSCDLLFHFPRAMGSDLSQLSGKGSLKIEKGQIMRMKGFVGLLELLAERVPGFASLTDSTQGSCDYTITNGRLATDNLYIEGNVFSIKMYGEHDFVNDRLNFTARVQFTKKDSVAGHILHPLTWPFTKLLLEFKLTGSTENPKWEYISVIDRVLEVTK